MPHIGREQVKEMMADVIKRQGRASDLTDDALLEDVGFRSLDFSELALRVEDESEKEFNFDAPGLRSIITVADVLDFIESLQQQA